MSKVAIQGNASGTGTLTIAAPNTNSNYTLDLPANSGTLTTTGSTPTFTGAVTAPGFIPNSSTVPSNGVYLPAANAVGIATNTTNRMYIDSSGNVGIGISTPQNKLQVDDGGASQTGILRINNPSNANNNYGVQLLFSNINSGTYRLMASVTAIRTNTASNYNSDLLFATNSSANGDSLTERMRIDSSGNVGIGTTSPATKLDVNGIGRFRRAAETTQYTEIDTGGGVTNFNFINGASATYQALTFNSGNNSGSLERARIDSNGNLLVGRTDNPSGVTNCIYGAGNYNATTATAANVYINSEGLFFRSTSALKYKTDIRDLESIDINKFRPVRYKSKCENDDQTKDHFGIVADEVAENGFEELVIRGENDEVEGFQYERMTVVLLKAIQELKAELDATKAEVAALKAKE